MTNREHILNWIRSDPGKTDTRLHNETDVSPRNQVVNICHELEWRGFIERRKGDDGMLHNCPVAWVVSPSGSRRRRVVVINWGQMEST